MGEYVGTGGSEILSTGISRYGVNAVVVTTVLSALAFTLAFLRFLLRRREAFGVDDYVLMAALVFLVLQLVGQYLLAFRGGEGWDMRDLAANPEKITWLLLMIYYPALGYTTVVVLIKTSILFSYNRIFGHLKRTRYHIYILLGLSWAWGIGVFFVCMFQCTPVDKAWHPEKVGHCIDLIPFLWGNSISNFIIDWMILAVPILPVLKLQLPSAQKVLVGLSFLCGSLACIASTIRSSKTGEFNPADLGVSDYNASIWIFAEPPLAIISCCLPFLSRLFGLRVIRGFRYVTDRVTKASTGNATAFPTANSNAMLSGHTNNRAGAREDTSLDAQEELLPDARKIRKTTTTTVKSREAGEEGHEMNSYQLSITAPARLKTRSESQSSLV